MAKRSTPPLSGVDTWFETTILPDRTTWSGFSGNRIWKAPRGLLMGNQDDPNGLCGDTATYVLHQFEDTFRSIHTPDGYQMGLVLWNSVVFNHIANVMLPVKRATWQRFVTVGTITTNISKDTAWSRMKNRPTKVKSEHVISGKEMMQLRVYDLYYKMKPTTVAEWWKHVDGGLNGRVEVGLEFEFA